MITFTEDECKDLLFILFSYKECIDKMDNPNATREFVENWRRSKKKTVDHLIKKADLGYKHDITDIWEGKT